MTIPVPMSYHSPKRKLWPNLKKYDPKETSLAKASTLHQPQKKQEEQVAPEDRPEPSEVIVSVALGAGKETMAIDPNNTPIDPDGKYPDVREAKRWQRIAPNCWELFFGKKYCLPKYRQADYVSQDFINYMEWATLIALPVTKYRDDIMNACFCNTAGGLYHGRPTLFLERELGEPLLRTKLPEDMMSQDIKWKWPAFRVYLPRDLIKLGDHWLTFMDIGLLEEGESRGIPQKYAVELDAAARYMSPGLRSSFSFQNFQFHYPDRAIVLSGILNCVDGRTKNDMTTYAMVKPFKNYTVKEIREMTKHLASAWECDSADDNVTRQMEHLAIQVLLFLSAFPLGYAPETIIRKPAAKGQRQIPGLYAARFVGQSQIRPDRAGQHAIASAPTGRTVAAHWVAGFWRRQPCGPGSQERRLQWIKPYPTGELRDPVPIS